MKKGVRFWSKSKLGSSASFTKRILNYFIYLWCLLYLTFLSGGKLSFMMMICLLVDVESRGRWKLEGREQWVGTRMGADPIEKGKWLWFKMYFESSSNLVFTLCSLFSFIEFFGSFCKITSPSCFQGWCKCR